MLSIGNRCLTPGYEREREKRGRERGCVCVGAFQQGLCSPVAVVPHRSTVRHPEGYKDNKAAVKFGRFQWFMLTFANSSHMAICASKVLERGSQSLHSYTVKYTRKVKRFSSCGELTCNSYSWRRRPPTICDPQATESLTSKIVFGVPKTVFVYLNETYVLVVWKCSDCDMLIMVENIL